MRKKVGLIDGLNDSCFGHPTRYLTELCRMIEAEVGEKPSLTDLCDLLAVSLRGCSSDLFADVNVEAIQELKPKVAPHKK